MNESQLKAQAAQAALDFIEDNMIIGVGTGSTVSYFIQALERVKHRIEACIASSNATEAQLRGLGIPVIDLNTTSELPIYIDSADEITLDKQMIKGGGGALTREKIIATVAQKFICIVDETKVVEQLGGFSIAVEVLPIARSFVAREIVKLGGSPVYRENYLTDNGNIILDIVDLPIYFGLEDTLNQIPGVIENGIFSKRKADVIIVAGYEKLKTYI